MSKHTKKHSPHDLATLVEKVSEAQANVAYWRRQAVIRHNRDAIAEAKGLASAWESTLAARAAKLNPTATR
jgi:hypothetical protein